MLLRKISEAAQCGVDFIQLRERDLSARELEVLAQDAVRTIQNTSSQGNSLHTRLLINSRTDVAISAGAAGVHLRSDDVSAAAVRAIWERNSDPASPIVSVSCHSVGDVERAANEGADFAVFGPVFEKKQGTYSHASTGLDSLRQACTSTIPVLALGGVFIDNAAACMEAGAAGIAGIRLFQEHKIEDLVREWRKSL